MKQNKPKLPKKGAAERVAKAFSKLRKELKTKLGQGLLKAMKEIAAVERKDERCSCGKTARKTVHSQDIALCQSCYKKLPKIKTKVKKRKGRL